MSGPLALMVPEGFEQVVYGHDASSGLRTIVAIHSTALGPGLGGTRFWPFATEEEALIDVCRLAKGMSYKHAAAGLQQGGGKAVILGDPAVARTDALILAYARFVDGLSGRYVTAEDVGTTQADMDLIRTVTPHVRGTSERMGGSGDPSPATALGVLWAMRAVAERLWGRADLDGRHVCISGVGKVGSALADHLHAEGCRLSVADISPTAVADVAERTGATIIAPDRAHTIECDIFSPCALGAILSSATIPDLRAAAVVGSANNQLATPEDAQRIHASGVLYAPDYVVNAGGVINIAFEKDGYDRSGAEERIRGIRDTVRRVLDLAQAEDTTTAAAADLLAERTIDAGAPTAHEQLSERRQVPDDPSAARLSGGPTLTPDDLSVLHLHDRHTELGLSSEDLLGMYRTILTARVLDQKIWALNRMGKAAFVVSGQGHEGAQVGSAWALKAGHDGVLPYYRDSGVMLTLGMTVEQILLAVLARADDPNSGARQMPNHWGWPEGNVITGSSPIATQLPHAAGLAYAAKVRGEDRVVVSYFGEGATSKGDFHEALNFAGIHQLPMVFVCENNGYAISVPMSSESAVDDVADRAHSYGFGGVIVDGNDALDVYAAVHSAVRHARRGDGPTLIECKTYRYLAHTSDDDDRTYRTPQEVEAWRKKDPLRRITQYLIEQRLLSEADEERVESEVKAEVDAAAKRAEASAAPDPATAYDKVFARPLRPTPGAPADATPMAPPVAPEMPAATTERNVVDTVRWTQQRLMATDDRVMILGEDVGPRGGVFRATDGLAAEFGDARVVDTPLAESSIIGIGIGLALAGLRPIAEIQFADFIHSGFDQLVSEAARIHYRSNGAFAVPLVVRAPWGGGVHGALYHSQSIESTYAHIPGLKVVVPSTPADVCGMLRSAVDDPDPVLFLEHKKTYRLITGPVPDDDSWRVPIGVAEIARPGDDLTVVTYGLHRHLCLEAAQALADEDGASVEVIDLRTISPLDRDTVLTSVSRTGRCLVVHEDNVSFGVGAEVAAIVAAEAFWDLDAPVRRLATADVPSYPFAAPLEAELFIDTPKIIDAMRSSLGE